MGVTTPRLPPWGSPSRARYARRHSHVPEQRSSGFSAACAAWQECSSMYGFGRWLLPTKSGLAAQKPAARLLGRASNRPSTVFSPTCFAAPTNQHGPIPSKPFAAIHGQRRDSREPLGNLALHLSLYLRSPLDRYGVPAARRCDVSASAWTARRSGMPPQSARRSSCSAETLGEAHPPRFPPAWGGGEPQRAFLSAASMGVMRRQRIPRQR